MNTAFLLLGGNLGSREKFLWDAVAEIEKRAGSVFAWSSLYETEAWPARNLVAGETGGSRKKNKFLNQAIAIHTRLTPGELMAGLLETEKFLGRVRSGKKWDDRPIDIDILFFLSGEMNGEDGTGKKTAVVVSSENLQIPHPALHLRRFALVPLHEIAPGLVHPVLEKTVTELLAACPDKLPVEKVNSVYGRREEARGMPEGSILPPGGAGKGLYNFIAIEGNIGSGKTSLAERIAAHFNARLMLEQFADNPFLPKFYSDRDKYAFPLEMSFLAERYNQVKEELSSRNLFHPVLVSDYVISKCLVFAKINLQSDEFNLYTRLFNIIYPTLPRPDLLVYLYLKTEQLLGNIMKRGRSYEQSISPAYLQNIQDGYFEFLRQQPDLRVLIVDTSRIDFVKNPDDFWKILDVIQKPHPTGMTRILL